MRIDILAIGSLGDVQPTVALGLGLAQAGHRVRIVTLGGFEDVVRDRGLAHVSIAGSRDAIADTSAGRNWIRRRERTVDFLHGFVDVARALIRSGMAEYWGGCRDAEAIIATPMGLLLGVHLAERLRVPLIRVHFSPFTPTRFDWNGRRTLRTALRTTATFSAGAAFRFAIWSQLRGTTNAARRDILGLPALPFQEPFGAMDRRRVPVLDAYSPAVVTRPPDWGDWIHVTGYWFLDAPGRWTPPAVLAAFLEAGEPPVFVGFGSTPFPAPDETTRLVIRALETSGQRGVIVAGGSGLPRGRLADHVLSIDSVPHGWLFPRVRAAVHHGGAGVTAAALRAGLPSVVVPVFADQPFWGRRVFELGAGPRPIPARRLSVDALSQAIRCATHDEGMQRQAARLGARIRGEDGVARAIEILGRYVGRPETLSLAREYTRASS